MSLRRRDQRDFENEIASHLELETDRLIAEGMDPDEARLAARRRFGNISRAQERYHDGGRGRWLEQLSQDVRYAARMLRKSPFFTIIATITLALGIGASTAVFSVLNGVLFAGFPYTNADRVVKLWETLPTSPQIMVSYPDYLDWRARTHVFEDIALYSPYGGRTLTSGDIPRRLSVGTATGNLFALLGVHATTGRLIGPADDVLGAERTVVFSESYWRSRLGSDPNAIGRVVTLDGQPYKVVGILPPVVGLGALDAWIPMAIPRAEQPDSYTRGNHPATIGIGRLKPGVTLNQMRADLDRVSKQIAAENPNDATDIGASGDFLAELLVHEIKPALTLLAWAVLCVLLIACVNVANLLLGRATSRDREIALRLALGASSRRVLRLLLAENVLLALIGGTLGVGLAFASVKAIVTLRPPGLPRLGNIHISVPVLAFAAVLSIATGLVFGLLPARQANRLDLNDSLKAGGRGTSAGGGALRLRNVLMVTEVALALVLLIGAGLLTRSVSRLLRVDPGVNAGGVMTGWLNLPRQAYPDEDRQRLALENMLRAVQAVPGVSSAAITSALPLGANRGSGVTFSGHPRPKGQEPLINIQLVSPDYFATMGMRVAMGRGFAPSDVKGERGVAWISEAIAKKYFAGENPIGKRIIPGPFESTDPGYDVVGIVNDVPEDALGQPPRGVIYYPFDQQSQSSMALVIRGAIPFDQVMPAVRRAIASVDKVVPLSDEKPLATLIDESTGQERFTRLLLAIFAGVSLVLAAVGVYGVIAYFVAQRSQEIGIRMALGASRANIASLITMRVLATTAVGVAIGLAGAFAASGLMTRLLYSVPATDATTYVTCAIILLFVAAAAALLPTLRAMRVSPVSVMRAD